MTPWISVVHHADAVRQQADTGSIIILNSWVEQNNPNYIACICLKRTVV